MFANTLTDKLFNALILCSGFAVSALIFVGAN